MNSLYKTLCLSLSIIALSLPTHVHATPQETALLERMIVLGNFVADRAFTPLQLAAHPEKFGEIYREKPVFMLSAVGILCLGGGFGLAHAIGSPGRPLGTLRTFWKHRRLMGSPLSWVRNARGGKKK